MDAYKTYSFGDNPVNSTDIDDNVFGAMAYISVLNVQIRQGLSIRVPAPNESCFTHGCRYYVHNRLESIRVSFIIAKNGNTGGTETSNGVRDLAQTKTSKWWSQHVMRLKSENDAIPLLRQLWNNQNSDEAFFSVVLKYLIERSKRQNEGLDAE